MILLTDARAHHAGHGDAHGTQDRCVAVVVGGVEAEVEEVEDGRDDEVENGGAPEDCVEAACGLMMHLLSVPKGKSTIREYEDDHIKETRSLCKGEFGFNPHEERDAHEIIHVANVAILGVLDEAVPSCADRETVERP